MTKTLVLAGAGLGAAEMALLDRVNGLDLSHVEGALVARDGLSAEAAAESVYLYRAWRFLAAAHPEQNVLLPEAADEAWHWDILHTESYAIGCAAIEGYYLHHRPGVAADVVETEWPSTVKLFGDVLGIDLQGSAGQVGNCVRDPANCVRIANCVRAAANSVRAAA